MSIAEKLFSGLFFFLLAPTMLLIAPTGLSVTVVVLALAAYTARSIHTTRYRCSACGHIFKLSAKKLPALLRGQCSCPSCCCDPAKNKLERL